ncbi:MAG: carbohydrate kinase family protein [ANME-2 cluster archaeon]|nr:carbohydrate kinase family protein [ANME-2 cluster archaeon]
MTLQTTTIHLTSSHKTPQVIGFGALNLDKIFYVDRIVKPDEEGFISSVENHPGGSGANTMVGLSRLGIEVGYIGKVANDEAGKLLQDDLASEGVNTSGVAASSGRSGACLIMVDGRGDRGILVDPGVNDTITAADIDLEMINNVDLVHFTSFVCRGSDTSFETQKQVATCTNADLSLDPGTLYAERGMEALMEFISQSRVVLPSDHELKLMTGCLDVSDGADMLIDAGAKWVAVKMGSRGCYVTDGTSGIHIPAQNVKVVDTTGAGDAFNAGFLFGMLEEEDIETCGKIGNIVASISIGQRGARSGLPYLAELIEARAVL